MNSDPAARATFRAISEAYSILGHDRERCVPLILPPKPLNPSLSFTHRRTYDRTLADPPLAKPDYNYTTFYETRRRRGPKATYAWEPRRSSPSSLNQQSSSSSSSRPHRHDHDRPGPSPFFHPGQKHSRKTRQNSSMSEQDGVVGVSSFWRAVQVSGLIAVVIAVGGAFGK